MLLRHHEVPGVQRMYPDGKLHISADLALAHAARPGPPNSSWWNSGLRWVGRHFCLFWARWTFLSGAFFGKSPEAVLRDVSWRKQVPALLRSRANSAFSLVNSSRFLKKTQTFAPMACLWVRPQATPFANLAAKRPSIPAEWERILVEYVRKTCHSSRHHPEVVVPKNGTYIN